MAELMNVSRPHAHNLVRWASDRSEVLVLSADLTSSCEADLFRDAYPDRFISLGMGEQNMMGFAGGLAREGFRPYVHTFAVFVCRRPFDQVAMSIAYPNLPVRLLGFLPGITTPGGVTHQAIDDLALMRTLPNMTVLACGDATDVESVLDVAEGIDGPVYVRMLRGEVPRLFSADEPMRLSEWRELCSGDDLLVLTCGICTGEALSLCQALNRQGLGIRHLHLSTIKPFPSEQLVEAAAGARYGVVTMENHSIIGGLGSAMAEAMADAGLGKKLRRLGLQDTYAHGASREYLMHKYGIDRHALLGAVEAMAGRSISLGVDKLSSPKATASADDAKPEAL